MKTRSASTSSLLLLALACGTREPREPAAAAPGSLRDTETTEALGGMDGAGTFGLGLSSAEGVFVQALWQEERLRYLVINDRPRDIELTVSDLVLEGTGPREGQRVAGPWRVPAGSLQAFDADDLVGLPPPIRILSFRLDDGTPLGWAYRPSEPRWRSSLPVVSTLGSNGSTSEQVETDFVAAPGPTFTVSLALSPGGDLTLWSKGSAVHTIGPVVDVLAVRSERGTVRSTATGFVVVVPGTSDFERSSLGFPIASPDGGLDAAPTRVEVDVAIPPGVGGSIIRFYADRCFLGVGENGECSGGGGQASRAFPLSE